MSALRRPDDPTTDPDARSWVAGADGSGFPLQNLPYGACRSGDRRFLGVRIGDAVVDLGAADRHGLFDGLDDRTRAAACSPDLGPLLALDPPVWQALRSRLGAILLRGSSAEVDAGACLVPLEQVTLGLPFPVADFVDFYSSIDHATNIGRMFRPDAEPLLPNWRHLPVGYHGRAGTVVASGSPVVRPWGQRPIDDHVEMGPTRKLDMELEVGFVLGNPTRHGRPVATGAFHEHVFGVVLVNDWSARDIQSWEYVPLGPFLGKSFATSVSGWVVPIDALEPFRVPGPRQDPPVLPYLRRSGDWGLDLRLAADLVPSTSSERHTICEVGFAATYWTPDQQLAHLTVNGASIRAGDLIASGTVSGRERHQRGSLIELSWNGDDPLELGAIRRSFLEDGDEIVLRGAAVRTGHPTIQLGEVRGTIAPAVAAGAVWT